MPRKGGTPASFKPGQSGNPGGRPAVIKNLQDLARQHTEAAVLALVEALSDKRTKVAAATALLDRGYGRPIQSTTVRMIREIGDLSDQELAALAGVAEQEGENDGTRH